MNGKTLFSIIAALLPVFVCNYVADLIKDEKTMETILLSGVVSFVLLAAVQFLLDRFVRRFNRLNKYCGHWVEEMTLYHKDEDINNRKNLPEKFIGIGIIRYDKTTGEYVFVGKTYSLDGIEKYAWSIHYLHPEQDESVQYVCSVQIPGERSIGQITFYNKDECEGTIWIMDGNWYKFNGYRIKLADLLKLNISPVSQARQKWRFYRGVMFSQHDNSEFVRKYSKNRKLYSDCQKNDEQSSDIIC